MTIIELCQIPGIPKTKLMYSANVNYNLLIELLFGLIEAEIIEKETRPRSYVGQKRDTVWYQRTREGDEIYSKFKELEKKLSIRGAHSRSGSQ